MLTKYELTQYLEENFILPRRRRRKKKKKDKWFIKLYTIYHKKVLFLFFKDSSKHFFLTQYNFSHS